MRHRDRSEQEPVTDRRTRRRAAAAVAAAMLTHLPAAVRADDVYNQTDGGNWATAAYWSAGVPGAVVADLPANSGHGYNVNYNYTYGSGGPYPTTVNIDAYFSFNPISYVTVNNTTTLTQSVSSTVLYANNENIGNSSSGIAYYNQTAGLNSCTNFTVGNAAGSGGVYNLGGSGAVTGVSLVVGNSGNGTVNQTSTSSLAEISTLTLAANTGSAGLYQVSGGTLLTISVGYVGNGGNGTFNQTGGSVGIGSGASGDGLYLGNNSPAAGTFNLTGPGTLGVSGVELVGVNGNGVFNQSAGMNSVGGLYGGTLYVGGSGSGLYLLTGTGSVVVNHNLQIQNGSFNQSGGTVNVGSGAISDGLTLGNLSSSTGTYNLTGAAGTTLTVNGSEYAGASGPGVFNQSAGVNTVSANLSVGGVGSGLYLLAATGSVIVNNRLRVQNGVFNQSNGSVQVAVEEDIGLPTGAGQYVHTAGTNSTPDVEIGDGSSGSYSLSGAASLTTTYEDINPRGTLTQSAGSTNTVATALGVASGGTYQMSGGTLLAANGAAPGNEAIKGLFVQSGGTHVVGTGAPLQGLLVYNGGSFVLNSNNNPSALTVNGLEYIGFYTTPGNATFNQTGGTHTVTQSLIVGETSAGVQSFYLGGTGTLAVGTTGAALSGGEYVGDDGVGLFVQTGGTHTVGLTATNQNLYLGYNAGSVGTYSLAGTGVLTVNGNVYVGGTSTSAGGVAAFNLFGGSATVTGVVKVWSGGALNIAAGVLTVPSIDLTGGAGLLNWTGGQINLTRPITIDANFGLGPTVTVPRGGSLVVSGPVTNNGQVTLNGGSVSEAGGFTNNGLVTGYGAIAVVGGSFINYGELTQGNGDLSLSETPFQSSNVGNINLAPGHGFTLVGTVLGNPGTINLNGATINLNTGAGSVQSVLNNGGTIAGRGAINGILTNGTQATIIAQGGTLTLPAFNNSGAIQSTAGATIAGGAITNTGSVAGAGTVNNAITNNGTVQAVNGILTINGALTNPSSGTLYAVAGADVVANSFPTNAGAVQLAGGIFDTGGHVLSNAGTISGFGSLRTGGLTNAGTIALAGGAVNGPVTNNAAATIHLSGNSANVFYGVVVNAGTVTVDAGANGTFYATFNGSSGTLVDNGSMFFAANSTTGTISGTGVITIGTTVTPAVLQSVAAPSAPASTLASANIPTGSTFDLGRTALDVNAEPLAVLTAAARLGFNTGTWTGTGLNSSAAATDSRHLTAVGVIQNNQGGVAIYSPARPFHAVVPGPGDVLAAYTYYGDANLDGKVDGSDYSLLDAGYLAHATGWYGGDFNYDGVVDGSDYTLIDNVFNRQSVALSGAALIAAPTSEIVSASAAVPEPASLASAAVAIAGVLGFRRRHSQERA